MYTRNDTRLYSPYLRYITWGKSPGWLSQDLDQRPVPGPGPGWTKVTCEDTLEHFKSLEEQDWETEDKELDEESQQKEEERRRRRENRRGLKRKSNK